MIPIRGVLVVVALLGTVTAVSAHRAEPVRCADARWVVTAGGERLGDGSGAPVVLVVAGGTMTLDGGCAPTAQRLRVTRRGTRVRLRIASCAGLRAVRVQAVLAPSCDAIGGRVRAKRTRPTAFAAAPSRCDDGIADAGAGEQCDGAACDGAVVCVGCGCGAPVTTTTLPPAASCVTSAVPIAGFTHVPVGSAITYPNDPPSSGNHYPIWARWGVYTQAVPRGYWVHNLEHGGVVVLHRPDVGAASVGALHAAFDAVPLDPACTHRRTLLTPDPLMTPAVAVVSWGWQMLCDGVDQQAIVAFAGAHRGNGREDLCAQGGYP
ncbi:MAG: DUF3105 domain-containing protein [bacterium]|nr:DUF3105 domain-containing protein [bacterium]